MLIYCLWKQAACKLNMKCGQTEQRFGNLCCVSMQLKGWQSQKKLQAEFISPHFRHLVTLSCFHGQHGEFRGKTELMSVDVIIDICAFLSSQWKGSPEWLTCTVRVFMLLDDHLHESFNFQYVHNVLRVTLQS